MARGVRGCAFRGGAVGPDGGCGSAWLGRESSEGAARLGRLAASRRLDGFPAGCQQPEFLRLRLIGGVVVGCGDVGYRLGGCGPRALVGTDRVSAAESAGAVSP